MLQNNSVLILQVSSESRQIMDEIIFSGAGKDCLEDDDDKDCKVILEQKTGV